MKLSTRGQYAVMAMVDLAKHNNNNQPMSLSSIAVRQDISLPYLEQLFGKLRRAGLVISVRGAQGGYYLADVAQKIKLSQIIDAADEEISITRCKSAEGLGCTKAGVCHTHNLWQALADHIESFLQNVNLQDLLDKKSLNGLFQLSDMSPKVGHANIDNVRV
ncbi:MAG: Rrf2 family transcriptional regulator [Rhizobiales bacterium]|nr:Rrf2 family transcriptional regulator [Hyphomicrobiales bacterium]